MQKKWNLYLMSTGKDISFEDFTTVKKLKEFHEKNVGTVIKGYNKDLSIYPHFMHFGLMFFYKYLTNDQITNGPVVEDAYRFGQVCCF